MGVLRSIWHLYTGRPGGLRRTALARVFACTRSAPTSPAAPFADSPETTPEAGAWQRVGAWDDLADGTIAEVVVAGAAVAVVRQGDAVFAVDNTCPHAGGAMGDGEVEGPWIRCPLHGWGFDLRTGACDVDPDVVLPVWRAEVRAGGVWVAPPDPSLPTP